MTITCKERLRLLERIESGDLEPIAQSSVSNQIQDHIEKGCQVCKLDNDKERLRQNGVILEIE